MDYEYPIDYNSYTIEEVTNIINFLSYLEDNKGNYEFKELKKRHDLYKKAINSIQEEKRIEKEFLKLSGIDVYKTLRQYSL